MRCDLSEGHENANLPPSQSGVQLVKPLRKKYPTKQSK